MPQADPTDGTLEPCYVLHRRPYRNTSVLAELFTRDSGRIGVVARGARASRSRWRGLLEPFVALRVSWRGRGELRTLTQIEEAGQRAVLAPRRLASAFYVNELLLRLTERFQPMHGLFAGYCRVLHALAGDPDIEPPLRLFEYDLLDELGLTLRLEYDSDGEPVDAHASYTYDPQAGPVRHARPGNGGSGWISGRSLLAYAARDLGDESTRHEVKQITRAAIERHLEGRPLHSRWLYRRLRSIELGGK